MEVELFKVVVVTVLGTRPYVDLASAAKAIHRQYGINPSHVSIRAFSLEDFLVLRSGLPTRNRLVNGGRTFMPCFMI